MRSREKPAFEAKSCLFSVSTEILNSHKIGHVVKAPLRIDPDSTAHGVEIGILNVASMPRRIHPKFDHRFGEGTVGMWGDDFPLGSKGVGKLSFGIGWVYFSAGLVLETVGGANVFSHEADIDSSHSEAVRDRSLIFDFARV